MDQVRFIKTYKPRVYAGPSSMVSLYIPGSTNLNDLRQTMKKEATTASNIKNNTNRKSVQASLTAINEFLKGVKQVPDEGMALFAERYI